MTGVTGQGDAPPGGDGLAAAGTPGGEAAGVTFEAFARIIGKSRPYVSKLVAQGRIRAPALTPDRKIIPALAQQQIAEGSDPARTRGGAPAASADDGDPTYATLRARLTAAQAARAELELGRQRGELVEAVRVEAEQEDIARRVRDRIMQVPREVAADCARLSDEIAIEATMTLALRRVMDGLAQELLSDAGVGRAA